MEVRFSPLHKYVQCSLQSKTLNYLIIHVNSAKQLARKQLQKQLELVDFQEPFLRFC